MRQYCLQRYEKSCSEQKESSFFPQLFGRNQIIYYLCPTEKRYYFDARGACIDVITQSDDNDKGHAAKLAAQRYQQVFNALL